MDRRHQPPFYPLAERDGAKRHNAKEPRAKRAVGRHQPPFYPLAERGERKRTCAKEPQAKRSRPTVDTSRLSTALRRLPIYRIAAAQKCVQRSRFARGDTKGAGFVVLRRATVYDCTRSGFVKLRRDKPSGRYAARREICRNFVRHAQLSAFTASSGCWWRNQVC